MKRLLRSLAVVPLSMVLVAGLWSGAATAAAAPATGPALLTPQTTLAAALQCDSDLRKARKTPILLVHATGSTPEENWSWGYQHVLPKAGYPVCTVRLPERSMAEMQTAAEYVVAAIRFMNDTSGRKVSTIGHSQGGANVAWALKFWPDLAGRVDDAVSMGTPYNGTLDALAWCAVRAPLGLGCQPATWQQSTGSNYDKAFNAVPLPAGPSFTQVWSLFDEVSTPSWESSPLRGGTNIQLQSLCPARPVEHLLLAADGATYDIVMDALTHSGPANKSRLSPLSCLRTTIPGMDLVGFARYALPAAGQPIWQFLTAAAVPAEPKLRDYALAALGR